MLIPQYQVLVLKLSPIYTVSLNTVFSIHQNQYYQGTPYNNYIYQYADTIKEVLSRNHDADDSTIGIEAACNNAHC
jgi:hypothetical protein